MEKSSLQLPITPRESLGGKSLSGREIFHVRVIQRWHALPGHVAMQAPLDLFVFKFMIVINTSEFL